MEDGKICIKLLFFMFFMVEVIFVINSGMVLVGYFGDGFLYVVDIVLGFIGVIVKDFV